MRLLRSILAMVAAAPLACTPAATSESPEAASAKAAPVASTTGAASAAAGPSAEAPPAKAVAVVGQPAPAFELPDVDGKPVKLADFAGKVVVLEWFNPECPFVQAAHERGSLKTAAKDAEAKGVVWLAINSGAPGKQGHGVEATKRGLAAFKLTHRALLDESGAVGKSYGAERTPQLFVIDAAGVVRYIGPPDSDASGEAAAGDEPLTRYLDDALAAVLAGKDVPNASAKPWGCSVKYAAK